MKHLAVSPYDAWAEAERIANRTECALRNVLLTGHTPSEYLHGLVRQRRRDARLMLIVWLWDIEEKCLVAERPSVDLGQEPPLRT
ncbi:hypothetical protein VAR608DRAFT_2379 [Variovorax sp. HW608]|nr:hypothetical protein VAR608DRAFT_2379 [Variovorax sp. HW608]